MVCDKFYKYISSEWLDYSGIDTINDCLTRVSSRPQRFDVVTFSLDIVCSSNVFSEARPRLWSDYGCC